MVALISALLIVCACGIANGQQIEEVPTEPLPSLLQQPAYAAPVFEESPEPFQGIACADECVDCGPLIVQDSHWYAGVDVLATRFSYTAYNTNWNEPTIAVRPYIGWENDSGIGFRGRWWFLGAQGEAATANHLYVADSIFPYDSMMEVSLSAANLDVEFYRRFYYDATSFVLGVGTKATSIDYEYGPYTSEQSAAAGVGAFAEGIHPLYVGPKVGCAFIGYARIGLLTGEIESRYETHFGTSQPYEYDLNMSTTEIGIGLELTRTFRRWDFVFQLVTETQRWEQGSIASRNLSFDALGLRFGGQW
ncbi:MAG: hypothetical protein WD851_04005 [Pirellulales bacterium]